MPSLLLCTGFEHGLTDNTSLTKGNVGIRFADAFQGAPAVVSTTPRSGSYCLECSSSAATEALGWSTNTIGTSKQRMVVGFGVYFPSSLPGSNGTLAVLQTGGDFDAELMFQSSNSKLCMTDHNGSNLIEGPVATADTWYWIDIDMSSAGTAWFANWQVDGAAQTQWTVTASAAADFSNFWLGWRFDTETQTVRYDDLVLSTTAADYPLGEHKVLLLKPDTGGSTAEIGTADATARFTGNATADTTHNSADILAATSEVPPLIGSTATGVCQRTSGSGNAVGIPMTTYTLSGGESISGLRVEIVGWAGSATTNNIGLRTHNGSTETTLFATADPNFDNSTTSPGWLCKMATAADFDSQAELDAMVVRLGYSTDVAPLPGAHAIFAEVAVKESTGPPAAKTPQFISQYGSYH